MASQRIMQGDSFPIFISLKIGGKSITEMMVEEVLVCIGDAQEYRYSTGQIKFAKDTDEWYFTPTQSDTLALNAGEGYIVEAHVKFNSEPNLSKKGIRVGTLIVEESHNKKVI